MYKCAGVENASTETRRANGRVQRTNNAVESFHNTFGRLVKVSHPSFYAFMEYLQEVTLSNMADVQRLDRGGQIRRPKKKQNLTRMWANAQPDGRPVQHRWRPLFNAAKFG